MSITDRSSPTAQESALKPLLRGWLHLGFTPIALVAGLVLTAFAPTLPARIACAVYTLTAVQLFATSAAYHRGNWKPDALALFRRIDHANIFVFIAGTYTPLTVVLLDGGNRVTLLALVWSLAVLGVLFRVVWLSAPRWLYTLLYVAMGWAAVGWLNQFWVFGGGWIVGLIIAGGLIYTLGAIAYGTKRPRLSQRWFGFHELFHSATVLAASCHLAAIALAVFTVA